MRDRLRYFLIILGVPIAIISGCYLFVLDARAEMVAHPEVVAAIVIFFVVLATIASSFITSDFKWPDDRADSCGLSRHKGHHDHDHHGGK